MIKRTIVFCMIATCYLVCIMILAETCYNMGQAQGFKDGQQATLKALEAKLIPFIDTCNKAMERLQSINNLL